MTLSPQPRLFLDADGVLADFDRAAIQVFGMPPRRAMDELGNAEFWRRLRSQAEFFANLPLLPDAMTLFRAVQHLHPTILTGCPLGGWAEAQKKRWAAQHFPGTPIITCMAREKARRAQVTPDRLAILVDDTLTHRHLWEDAGGIFIHHTSAASTLRELKQICGECVRD